MKKTIQDLKKMISEPASKEWFQKHGLPKGHSKAKALSRHKPKGYPDKFTSAKDQDTGGGYKPYK